MKKDKEKRGNPEHKPLERNPQNSRRGSMENTGERQGERRLSYSEMLSRKIEKK